MSSRDKNLHKATVEVLGKGLSFLFLDVRTSKDSAEFGSQSFYCIPEYRALQWMYQLGVFKFLTVVGSGGLRLLFPFPCPILLSRRRVS